MQIGYAGIYHSSIGYPFLFQIEHRLFSGRKRMVEQDQNKSGDGRFMK